MKRGKDRRIADRLPREGHCADGLHVIGSVAPVRSLGHVPRECPLGRAILRSRGGVGLVCLDRLARQEREPPQVRPDVAVVRVQPVLVERVRRRPLGVEPDRRPALRLAELRPGRGQEQLVRQPVGRLVRAPVGFPLAETGPPPDQLEPGRDVAPLVSAAHLEVDAHRPVKVLEVGGLDQHVAELGERQAPIHPGRDGVLGEHVRDREVLADVPQPVDELDLLQPVEVVDHHRARRPREIQEALQLAADGLRVCRQRLAVQEVPLGGGPRRVADHPRPAADQRDRPPAVALKLEQPEDRHEVADVERRSGRVEAVVAGDRPPGREAGRQARRRVVEHPPPGQLVEQRPERRRGLG